MTLQLHLNPNDSPRRRTILLVEDEPFVREVTRNILQRAGFEVLTAADTRDALQVYAGCNRKIDLVMTDMVLPGGTGHQLGLDLRQFSPQLAILMTSGYPNPENLDALDRRAFFLAKPYSRLTLIAKIETILDSDPTRSPTVQAS